MTKPHTTLSEAVRALALPTATILDTGAITSWEAECFARGALAMRNAAADLVEQHEAQEPVAPAILEALSYHGRERDDLTLEEAISVIRTGWRTVSGRTERAMVLQIAALLSAQPTLAATQEENAKDAARYRWLRHGDNDELVLMPYEAITAYSHFLPRNEKLDFAIDAAMAPTTDKKG